MLGAGGVHVLPMWACAITNVHHSQKRNKNIGRTAYTGFSGEMTSDMPQQRSNSTKEIDP